MPKLKYKSKKEHKHHHRHHHHNHKQKERYYAPPYIYENDHDQPDLPSEQSFKKTEEQEWQEKLFEAMVDEEDPFYTFYDHTPKSASTTEPHHMSDDAYAEYINQGMYRKRHAEEIAQQEARQQERARRRQEKEEAQHRLEREQHEQQKRYDHIQKQKAQELLEQQKKRYSLLWEQLSLPSSMTVIRTYRDIPWPTAGTKLTKESVRAFLTHHTAKQLRQEQLRYHPDKFIPKIEARFKGSPKDMERIRQKDNEISGWLNELWTERNTTDQ